MGKPYDHQYFFAGSGCSAGSMICRACNQPIFNHSQDWMSYKRSKSHDYSLHCFHRNCAASQVGWENIEAASAAADSRYAKIKADLIALANKHKITDAYSFAECAADALGCDIDSLFDY